MKSETALTKRRVISELTRSSHGKLGEYLPAGSRAAVEDGEFFAHLIAWNEKNGQIRDSKVALPVIHLRSGAADGVRENALAHLALLAPRDLLRADDFLREVKAPGSTRAFHRMVSRYLKEREDRWPWWERTALQHRESLRSLYARFHVKPSAMADMILFKKQYPVGTVFAGVKSLRDMTPTDAAVFVIEKKIPFLTAMGALGPKMKEPDLVLALIKNMTPTELVTASKMLERLGMRDNPALRGAYEEALTKASTSKKATFKATRAAEAHEAVEEKGILISATSEKLRGLQDRQMKALGSIEGNWLIIGDKSGSMEDAIEVSRQVSATLASMVKGEVHLVFVDTAPRHFEITGKSYDAVLKETREVTANGGTALGAGIDYALAKGYPIDGIAIVSDGEDNTNPLFVTSYKKLVKSRDGEEPPVYFYKTNIHPERRVAIDSRDNLTQEMETERFDMQTFDLVGKIDYYALPNIVKTMRAQKYELLDEIMETPLLTLDEAFAPRKTVVA